MFTPEELQARLAAIRPKRPRSTIEHPEGEGYIPERALSVRKEIAQRKQRDRDARIQARLKEQRVQKIREELVATVIRLSTGNFTINGDLDFLAVEFAKALYWTVEPVRTVRLTA